MGEEFDFDKIRLPPEMGRPSAPPKRGPVKSGNREVGRHIGCPLWWFRRALAAVKSKDQLAVALYLYRRSVVCKSATVRLSNNGLREDLGVGRTAKYLALKNLAAGGLISYEIRDGNATLVTILRRS
jgi:hypothetical protein